VHATGGDGGGMAELVDAADLKSADGNVVGVQVPLPPSPTTFAAAGFWQGTDGLAAGCDRRLQLLQTQPSQLAVIGAAVLQRRIALGGDQSIAAHGVVEDRNELEGGIGGQVRSGVRAQHH
jgi:hypothetical protein